jgi:hypothetical protein
MLDPPDGVNQRADRHGLGRDGRDMKTGDKCANMVHEAVPSILRQP